MTAHTHRALADCPVCGDRLVTTRLGCGSCGTELVGQFAPCPFCALDDADLEALKVFLVSRGNLKELQSHLGVSYPTARARFNDLLDRLGWLAEADADASDPDASDGHGVHEEHAEQSGQAEHEGPGEHEPNDSEADAPHASRAEEADPTDADNVRDQVLAQVAAGVLSPAVAADLLAKLR